MRVSDFLIVSVCFVIVASAASAAEATNPPPPFDQPAWNRAVENLLGALIMGPYADHFTPGNVTQREDRETRLKMQVNRLRARVGTRLSESLNDYEIICPFDHISGEAFVAVEQELRAKGWHAHWLPNERVRVCGGVKGFLLVSFKK